MGGDVTGLVATLAIRVGVTGVTKSVGTASFRVGVTRTVSTASILSSWLRVTSVTRSVAMMSSSCGGLGVTLVTRLVAAVSGSSRGLAVTRSVAMVSSSSCGGLGVTLVTRLVATLSSSSGGLAVTVVTTVWLVATVSGSCGGLGVTNATPSGAAISQVWNSSLLQLLRVLPLLGLARGGRQVRSVEQEVLWRLRRLPLRQLVQLAEQLAGQGAPGPLLPEVLRKLELRWTELEGTRTVVTLMAKVGHLSPALMERLEDKALELAEQFDPDELRRVALALALQQRRCVPLLRALSYHLLQKPAELPLPVLTDLLFAFSKLSFQQPQVLHRLALELQPHLGSLSPAQVLRCARSFGSLRWLSRPLAEAMAQVTGLCVCPAGPRAAAGPGAAAGRAPAGRRGVVPVCAAAAPGSPAEPGAVPRVPGTAER
uniref:FAKD4 protein n=1 Tax=Junco hyemalis TaxID=40217 RepID=A0A8C5IYT0_JUNHY